MHQCEQYGYHWAFASDPLCGWLSSGSQGLRAFVEHRYSKHLGNLKNPWKLSHVRNQICGFLDLLQANWWIILFYYPLVKVDGRIHQWALPPCGRCNEGHHPLWPGSVSLGIFASCLTFQFFRRPYISKQQSTRLHFLRVGLGYPTAAWTLWIVRPSLVLWPVDLA